MLKHDAVGSRKTAAGTARLWADMTYELVARLTFLDKDKTAPSQQLFRVCVSMIETSTACIYSTANT